MDGFGRSFQFRLPDGALAKKSWLGLFVSVIAITFIVFYAGMQLIRLHMYGEPSIMVSVRDSFYDTDFKFTSEQGLAIAAGITAYDNN